MKRLNTTQDRRPWSPGSALSLDLRPRGVAASRWARGPWRLHLPRPAA